MKKAYIKDIEIFLPSTILSNDDLVKSDPNWNAEKILDKVGIQSRHVASLDESSYTLALNACKALLSKCPKYAQQIDYVLYSTLNHEHFMLSSAALLHKQLGLKSQCGVMDFKLPCTGYLQLLSIAQALIESGAGNNILVVTADTYSKRIPDIDIRTKSIFGDAATATIISDYGFAEILHCTHGTEGEGSLLHVIRTKCIPSFETNNIPGSALEVEVNPRDFYMIGSEIFNFATEYIPREYYRFLESTGIPENEISYYIFHQANKFMLTYIRKRLGIAENRFYIDMHDVGNTSTSSIPIALYRTRQKSESTGLTLLCSFGGGYTWAFCLIDMNG